MTKTQDYSVTNAYKIDFSFGQVISLRVMLNANVVIHLMLIKKRFVVGVIRLLCIVKMV